jgi:hypothetical protein
VPKSACTVSTDERGDPRPGIVGQSNCDAGAYEVQSSSRTPQSVSFTSSPPAQDDVFVDYIPTATASSGLAVAITLDASSTGCDLDDTIVYFVSAGTCVIDANQGGNASYLAAIQAQQRIEIVRDAQSVSFSSSPPSPALVGGNYTPTAHATSVLPVTYSVDSSSSGCTLSGGVVSFVSAGTCVVDAIQAGNTDYAPAEAQQSFAISQIAQTVSFTSSAADPLVGGTYRPAGTATSSLGVTISLDPGSSGCTLKSGVVHFTSDGTCLVDANQAGNAMFAAAPQVQQTLVVTVDGLVSPTAVSSDGTDVWVANLNGNSVTELDASTGALVKVIDATKDKFDGPSAISSDRTHVWVANEYSNSVTELNASTGARVKVIDAAKFGIFGPDGVDSDGTHVWVTSFEGNSVTELNASTGALVRVISGDGLSQPEGVSSDGTHVWVTTYNDSVTELKARNGAFVAVLSDTSDPSDDFNIPVGVSSDGSHVWLTNLDGNSVTELNAPTGSLVQVISG